MKLNHPSISNRGGGSLKHFEGGRRYNGNLKSGKCSNCGRYDNVLIKGLCSYCYVKLKWLK